MGIVVDGDGSVVVMRIDRPEARNALDPATMHALGESLVAAESDPAVRAVVLTGTGDKAFSAGMDLKAFARGERTDPNRAGIDVLKRRMYSKPVVAAVNGSALAGGFELVLACDLVVAADHALFGLPEVKRALVAAGGGTAIVKRLPLAVALELTLVGESINAARALELGLVNRVVPGARAVETAVALAHQIAVNGPLAVRATKELVYDAFGGVDWDRIDAVAAPVFSSEDAREGAVAFAEKRPPRFVGR